MQFEFVTDQRGLEALAPDWHRLMAEATTPYQLFQDWHWVHAWWQNLAPLGHYDLKILVATQDNDVVMIWPWVLKKTFGARILEPVGGLMTCFHDALLASTPESDRVLHEGWACLRSHGQIDAIELKAVHQHAHIARLLEEDGGTPVQAETAPYVDLTSYPEFDAYLASRSKKMRQNQRRTAKYLAQQGTLSVHGDDQHISVDTAIDTSLNFKTQWLEARGLVGKTVITDESRAFLKQVCRAYAKPSSAVRLCISSVLLDDVPISVGVGFRHKGQHHEFLGSFDYRLEHFGPGRLRMEYGLRNSFERGITAYDMLTPDTAFKKIWTEKAAPVHHYIVALTPYGRIYRDLYVRKLRPRLKEVYQGLPAALKSSLVPTRLWG